MRRFWIIVLIAGFALVAVSAFQYLNRPDRGDVAPAFSLPTPDGKIISLEDYSGRPRIVHFWATWCGNCRIEFPSLDRVYDHFKDDGLMVFAISENEKESDNAVISFLREMDSDLPVLMDRGGTAADDYRSLGVPETIFVSRGGVIVARREGAVDWNGAEVRDMIRSLIEVKEGSNGAHD